jgi:hypothetical protein
MIVCAERGSRSFGTKNNSPLELIVFTSFLERLSWLGWVYETNRRSGEENAIHGRNTTINVDKIRGFRPPHVWMKTFIFLHVFSC